MSRALRVNTTTQVKVKFHLLRRGAAKRGWCFAAPPLFAAWSAAPIYLACLTVGFGEPPEPDTLGGRGTIKQGQ